MPTSWCRTWAKFQDEHQIHPLEKQNYTSYFKVKVWKTRRKGTGRSEIRRYNLRPGGRVWQEEWGPFDMCHHDIASWVHRKMECYLEQCIHTERKLHLSRQKGCIWLDRDLDPFCRKLQLSRHNTACIWKQSRINVDTRLHSSGHEVASSGHRIEFDRQQNGALAREEVAIQLCRLQRNWIHPSQRTNCAGKDIQLCN